MTSQPANPTVEAPSETLAHLVTLLQAGEESPAVAEAERLLEAGVDRATLVAEGVAAAMEGLDDKCSVEQFNLLEIMLVGRAMMSVVRTLYPRDEQPPSPRGTVVIASLEGDVHDLGKNIVRMILTARGYRVVDCGKDCPPDRLISRAEREKASAICVSGLLTTVIPQVRQLRGLAERQGLGPIPVLAGGAALKQAHPCELNADFVAETVFDGMHYLEGSVEDRA